MTEQQPKILQITQDIVQMPPAQTIVQMPATQDVVQIPATQDILQMAAQIVEIQPLKRALGGNRYLEFREWNRSKRIDLRFWKDGTVPTKEGVSLHLDQWKALYRIASCGVMEITRLYTNRRWGGLSTRIAGLGHPGPRDKHLIILDDLMDETDQRVAVYDKESPQKHQRHVHRSESVSSRKTP